MVDTCGFQRFAGSGERAPDLFMTLLRHSGRASQVHSLGARAQSCICWTSETRAVLPVPGSAFWQFAGNFEWIEIYFHPSSVSRFRYLYVTQEHAVYLAT